MEQKDICPTCYGNGYIQVYRPLYKVEVVQCQRCQSTGELREPKKEKGEVKND